MELTCQQCGKAFDLNLERKDETVTTATCPQCGAPSPRQSIRFGMDKDSSQPLPPVLSMAKLEKRRSDYVAISVFVVILLLMALSTVYLLRHLKNIPIHKPLDALTEGMDNLLSSARQQIEDLLQTIDTRKQRAPGAKRLVRRGYDHYVKNRFQKAMDALNQAIEKDPENPEAYYWRGRALIKLRRYDMAAHNFQKAITHRPDYWQAYDNLGWLCMRKGDYTACRVHFDRSIAYKPDNAWALYNRSRVHDRLGNREKALADAKKGCALKNKRACELLERYHKRPRKTPEKIE